MSVSDVPLSVSDDRVRDVFDPFHITQGRDALQMLREVFPEIGRICFSAELFNPPALVGTSFASSSDPVTTKTIFGPAPLDNEVIVIRQLTFIEDATSAAETFEVTISSGQGALWKKSNGAVFADPYIIGGDSDFSRMVAASLPLVLDSDHRLDVIITRPVAGELGGSIRMSGDAYRKPFRPGAF